MNHFLPNTDFDRLVSALLKDPDFGMIDRRSHIVTALGEIAGVWPERIRGEAAGDGTGGGVMDVKNEFLSAVEFYNDFNGSPQTTDTLRAHCGPVWDVADPVPWTAHHMIRKAIGNSGEAHQWEKDGATFSGAARRIKPRLMEEMNDR